MIAMNILPDHDAGADHNLEDHDIMIDKVTMRKISPDILKV